MTLRIKIIIVNIIINMKNHLKDFHNYTKTNNQSIDNDSIFEETLKNTPKNNKEDRGTRNINILRRMTLMRGTTLEEAENENIFSDANFES